MSIQLGISRCLLGQGVRFDGGHKKYGYATDLLAQYFEFIGICPEVESGLPIPRPTIRLVGEPDNPEVVEVKNQHISHTTRLKGFSEKKVKTLGKLSGFILKNKSPSCGMSRVKVYQPSPLQPKMGVGVFARALMDAFPQMPVEEEGRLNDPILRENFIERVFIYKRWQDLEQDGLTQEKLLAFHTAHKLILLAHHQGIYRQLGKFLACLKGKNLQDVANEYFPLFMKGMQKRATNKSHTNVLMHIQGYFKNNLDKMDKAELTETISRYQKGQVPLIVPMTLLKHHLLKHPDSYLQKQYYLFPYPEELMLRNRI